MKYIILAAQSMWQLVFESPEYTADVDAIGTLRLLEAIRFLGLEKKYKILSGINLRIIWQWCRKYLKMKLTPFYPRSPYAAAKLYAYWITLIIEKSYGMYACNGILFNHESPRRGETFVTRKLLVGLQQYFSRIEKCLYLGNWMLEGLGPC